MKDKEVLAIVLHLIVTVGLIGGYLYTVAVGNPDQMLQGACMVSVGWWFGKTGGFDIKKRGSDSNGQQP